MLNITRQQASLIAVLFLLFVLAVLIGFVLLAYQGMASAAVHDSAAALRGVADVFDGLYI